MAFSSTTTDYGFGSDPVVVRSHVDDIKGGVSLDVTDYNEEYIKAGHLIIRDKATQKIYKPLPVADGAFGSLPEGYEYVGVLISSIAADEPLASVLTIGEVNDKLTPYPLTDELKAAFKSAVPTINWAHD